MTNSDMKALYIVVNAGFAEQVVEFIRSKGSSGATIINARGINPLHKEIILTLVDSETAEKIIVAVKQNPAFKSEAHGICFTLPVTKTVGLNQDHAVAFDAKK